MATDLADQPLAGGRFSLRRLSSDELRRVQFARQHLFDINDFDETLPVSTASCQRLAASVAVAASAAMSDKQARSLAASTMTDYRAAHVRSYGAFSARNLAQPDRSSTSAQPHRESGAAA
jgi:hypothetical protein